MLVEDFMVELSLSFLLWNNSVVIPERFVEVISHDSKFCWTIWLRSYLQHKRSIQQLARFSFYTSGYESIYTFSIYNKLSFFTVKCFIRSDIDRVAKSRSLSYLIFHHRRIIFYSLYSSESCRQCECSEKTIDSHILLRKD